MPSVAWECLVILALIVANGLFAMSELALLTARKGRLKQWADRGDVKAQAALKLAEDPTRFLSTVQIGITVIGTVAGVFGGATLADHVAAWLDRVPILAPHSATLSLGIVVLLISYLSLVLGELVPKRIAMSDPERLARALAGPLNLLARLGVPLVRLLSRSTEWILGRLGLSAALGTAVTPEEIQILVREGAEAGVFEPVEHDLVRRVLRLDDLRAGHLMTPKSEVVWIDVDDSPEEIRRKILSSPHSHFPVREPATEQVLGFARAKDLLASDWEGGDVDLRGLVSPPRFLYEHTPGLQVLESFKQSGERIAVVLNEFGTAEGILSPGDLLEAIVGELPTTDEEVTDPPIVMRSDGSWLLDGMLPIDQVHDLLGMESPTKPRYRTLAGLVLDRLGHLPRVGESFVWRGVTFEVVDLDGHRVDKVLVVASAAQARTNPRMIESKTHPAAANAPVADSSERT